VTLLLRSAPGRGVYRAAETERERRLANVDPYMHCALTDLHAYVLALDAEQDRLGDGGHPLTSLVGREDAELALLRAQLTEESAAVRTVLAALRAYADPEGNLL
jgi:hypothetical protein